MTQAGALDDNPNTTTAQATVFPGLLALQRYPNNLPLQLNRFIGREREIGAIKQLMWSTRLLTLTGLGGSGKTRLALQVAADLLDAFADGVWLVELATLSEPALVPQAVASTLDLQEQPILSFESVLIQFLQPREVLLALDNCEHLITACAQLVEALLHACPNLHILATSREALNVAGEIAWPVPPLSMPDPNTVGTVTTLLQSDAAGLFVDRAVAIQPMFKATDHNAKAIAQICYQLDGIPLAIELAAIRVKALPVEKIASLLDDRFRLLKVGHRTAPQRHRTLRAVIDWSYSLLAPDEKILFRRLSAFAGGWTLDTAEAICSDNGLESIEVLDLLARLIDKSLVFMKGQNGQARYWMLETIRQYASDKLIESGEVPTLRNRHLDFFLRLAEEAEPQLIGPEQVTWLNRLDSEHDNVRAALRWAVESMQATSHAGPQETGLRLAAALWRFWYIRGYLTEGWETLNAALKRIDGVSPALQAKASTGAGYMAWCQGDYERATVFHQKALKLYQEVEDKQGIAFSLHNLGGVAVYQGNFQEGEVLLAESLSLARKLGDKWLTAVALIALGEIARYRGEYERAAARQEESLSLARETGEIQIIALSLNNLAYVATARGHYAQALEFHKESLTQYRKIGERRLIPEGLEGLAAVLFAQRQTTQAARLMAAAEALREDMHNPLSGVDRADYDRKVAAMRAVVDERVFAAAWAEGRALMLKEALAYALTEAEIPSPSDQSTPTPTSKLATKQKFSALTAREREVAALVAQGKSNREIAEALVVSEHTIATHLSNILSKLEFDSRTQIAGWAIVKGLATPHVE